MDSLEMILPRPDQNTAVALPRGVTLDELAAWSGSSKRVIKQWNSDGLFPTPVRKPDGGKRGRPHYRFALAAIPVAQRLALFRKYVTGVENTKLWLSIEGFTHLHITDAMIETRLRAWHQTLWRRAQHQMRSLARIDEAGSDDEVSDEILDDVDLVVRQRLRARFPTVLAEAGAGMMALMLGVADGVDVQDWCRDVQEGGPEGRRLVGFIEATIRLVARVSGVSAPCRLALTEDDERFLSAKMATFLPRLREFPEHLELGKIRLAWQAICSATDRWLSAPETAPDPWTNLACQWRRLCYRYPPEQTLLALAVIAQEQSFGTLGSPVTRVAKGEFGQVTGVQREAFEVHPLLHAQVN